MQIVRIATALALSIVLSLSLAQPASAASATTRDKRGDVRAARIDIVKASYTNGPRMIRFSVKVRDLRRVGTFEFQAAVPRSDVSWIVQVTNKKSAFFFQDVARKYRRTCRGIKTSWKPARNVVRAVLPHRCVPVKGALILSAESRWSGRNDWADSRQLRRG